MITLPLQERENHQESLFLALHDHALICYPTDSLYGLGGMATPTVVEKIDTAKGRLPGKKYSLIAPSWQRIHDHFVIPDNLATRWVQWWEQHGPITVLLTKKDPQRYAFLSPTPQLGVRWLPHHPIQQFVSTFGHPLITTSCNLSGEKPFVEPHALMQDSVLSKHIRYFLHAGPLPGPASTLISADDPHYLHKRDDFLHKKVT